MLDEDTRRAVFRLRREQHSVAAIARALGISKDSVRTVLGSGTFEVTGLQRPSRLDPHLERIGVLIRSCKGNLERVHEELGAEGVQIGYSTLTDFCRARGLGQRHPKKPAGEYTFEPGQEMQHDTSPHTVELGGVKHKLQCASLVLCFSRMIFAQVFFRWTRLQARQFLTEALTFFEGAAHTCMVDNSSVIIAHGVGPEAVPAAECQALAARFGFTFAAHNIGDANRSARVERPFHTIEHNFYAGRTFTDIDDANQQLRAWCERRNEKRRRELQTRPIDLFATERTALKPLPPHIPEIYEPWSRMVDLIGFVTLHTNRYSAPFNLIGQSVEVREYKDRVVLCRGPRRLCEHPLLAPGRHLRHRLPEHEVVRGETERERRQRPAAEEIRLREEHPSLATYVEGLRQRRPGRAVMALRRLERIWLDYPHDAVLAAVDDALHYGMFDMSRLERMVLRRIAGDVFGLHQGHPAVSTPDPEDNDDHQP